VQNDDLEKVQNDELEALLLLVVEPLLAVEQQFVGVSVAAQARILVEVEERSAF